MSKVHVILFQSISMSPSPLCKLLCFYMRIIPYAFVFSGTLVLNTLQGKKAYFV
jgi:hypothetical protein